MIAPSMSRAVWQAVEQYMRGVYRETGYQEVKGPQILDRSLWEKTGHWQNYSGPVEEIVRETLIRALELVLGVRHQPAVARTESRRDVGLVEPAGLDVLREPACHDAVDHPRQVPGHGHLQRASSRYRDVAARPGPLARLHDPRHDLLDRLLGREALELEPRRAR